MEVPENLSFEEAASIPETWLTAWKLISLYGKPNEGDFVLVHAGASGVGVAATQMITKHFGAKVISLCSSQEKIDFCVSWGATAGINYKEHPDFNEQVMEITSGAGVNVILDCVAASAFAPNLASIVIDGRWVLYGMLGGPELPGLNLAHLMRKRV